MGDHKQLTRAEVAAANGPDATLLVVHNRVFDVTAFLQQHPGGHEVLVGAGGQDASEDFDDIGHSVDARDLMNKYLVGEIVPHERVERAAREHGWEDVAGAGGAGAGVLAWRLSLLVAVAASLLWLYLA